MRNKLLLLIVMTMTTMMLTGCWDSVEINERHVVLDIAIDKGDEDTTDKNIEDRDYYQITYMIPDIAKLSGEDSLAENVKTAMVSKSPTFSKSVDDIETKTQNTLTFTHTKALILGEELLKDKKLFRSAIDGVVRNMEISRGTNILAVQGKASDVTESENYQNPVIGLYIMKYFNNTERGTSYAKQQVLGKMIKEIQDTNITTIPLVAKDEEGTIKIGGAAVIKDYELVGWLSKDEVRGQLFVDGNVKKVPIVVDYEGEYLTYQIEQEKRSISFTDEKQLEATIDIIVKGSITEYVSSEEQYAFSENRINQISELVQKEVKRQVEKTIVKSKDMNTDFLNIGLQMYRQHPKLWDKYGDKWNEQNYKQIPLKVNVKVIINNTGILE